MSATQRPLGQDISALPVERLPSKSIHTTRAGCGAGVGMEMLYCFFYIASFFTVESESHNWEENSCSICCTIFPEGLSNFPMSASDIGDKA